MLPLLILLLFILSMLHVIYWCVIRPLVLTKLRYKVFAARDQLRLLLINKQIGEAEPAFGIIERMCNSRLTAIPHLSLYYVMFKRFGPEIGLRVHQELSIVQEADPALRRIFSDITENIFGAVLINSPMWLPFIAVAALLKLWSYKVKEAWAKMRDDSLCAAYAQSLRAC